MKYIVVWAPSAENRLAQIWLSARIRDLITASAKDLERELEIHPLEMGESREFSRRIFLAPPLGVLYSVNAGKRSVRVLRVWEIKPPKR